MCWIAFALFLLSATSASAQDLTGKWAGWLESPGSTAAIRLRIAGRNTSEMTMNVYGQQSIHALRDLAISGADISFVTDVFETKFRFNGKLEGKTIAGTFDSISGDRPLTGRWSVRLFDDSNLVKIMPGRRGMNELPRPTGQFPIGRRTFYWIDESRDETITDDPSDKRAMLVQIWYPAANDRRSMPAPYIENLEELYATDPNLTITRSIKIHARQNATPARSATKLPVIVFAPGLGESISTYSGIIENLVSHGYAVAAFNPSHDAGVFKTPDGRKIDYNTGIWDQKISDTWTAEKRREFFDARRRGWAADMSFVLDRLDKLDGDLAGKFDITHAGALGHSFGGQAISIACADDARFKACANLDGLAQGNAFLPGAKGENLKQPFAFITKLNVSNDYELKLMGFTRREYDARERRRMLELWKPSAKTRLAALDQGTYLVVVRGATHASFSDGPLLEATPKDDTLADRKARAEVINEYIVGFFDKFLRRRNSRLFDSGDASQPTVVVEHLKK